MSYQLFPSENQYVNKRNNKCCVRNKGQGGQICKYSGHYAFNRQGMLYILAANIQINMNCTKYDSVLA